ncbi:hypothetical protein DM02DRAFT_157535 [Periconia macrospinosa]|uniref:Uncharacterized protein n=1 Tax=Periconia macrospinosa TaxID=97972 RepID=A0A2V1EFM0_9PLEO|nr:hypothetical protein DM02DRAFT_157535 [Periconia macrospinosa]
MEARSPPSLSLPRNSSNAPRASVCLDPPGRIADQFVRDVRVTRRRMSNGVYRFVRSSSSFPYSNTTTSTIIARMSLRTLSITHLEWWPGYLRPKPKSAMPSSYGSRSRKHAEMNSLERWLQLEDAKDSRDIPWTCWVQMDDVRDYSYMLSFPCYYARLSNVSKCSTIMYSNSHTKGALYNCTIIITQINTITTKRTIPLVVIHDARVTIEW